MLNAAHRLALTVALVATTLLPACGSGGASTGSTDRWVYTTAADCEAADKVKTEECGKAIDKAIIEHDQKAAKYPTMRDCEATEGIDRCERFAERHFRPRLMGYLFSQDKRLQFSAIPLYSGYKNATVFRDGNGKTYDAERTDGVVFSAEARRKAEGFAPVKRR